MGVALFRGVALISNGMGKIAFSTRGGGIYLSGGAHLEITVFGFTTIH